MGDYVLEIVEGPEAGRIIPLAGAVELGRDANASVVLQQDELLSRRHVRITPEADGARIEDLDSRNGTFVDGDQIFSPAHLAVDGQLLVGVTLLQLRTAETVASGATALRQIPAEFTTLRPLPAAEPAATTIRQVAPGLAVEASEPDYVPASALERGGAGQRGRALPAARRPHEGEGEGRADRDLRARGLRGDRVLRPA